MYQFHEKNEVTLPAEFLWLMRFYYAGHFRQGKDFFIRIFAKI